VITFVVEFVSHCVRVLIIHIRTSSCYAITFGCNGNCNCILFILIDKICIGANPYSLCLHTYVHMTENGKESLHSAHANGVNEYIYLIFILSNRVWGFKELPFCRVWQDIAIVFSVFFTKSFLWNQLSPL